MKYECHAVAHHSLNTQASGTNNTKSTTELSPVLIRILLRFQNVASTRLISAIIAALHGEKKTRMRRVKSFLSSLSAAPTMSACNYHIFNADGTQVCKTAHLKVMQTGRESWVVVLQKTVGGHDLSSPLQCGYSRD